jgi:uncharacterized membrane protein YjjP (DUF1212 family)
MLQCILTCISKIPWWAWLVLLLAAVLLGLLTYFTGGIAALSIPLWIQAVLSGLAGTIGATLLICINDCRGK